MQFEENNKILEHIIYDNDFKKFSNNILNTRNKMYKVEHSFLSKKNIYNTIEDLKENINDGCFSINIDNIHYECLLKFNRGKYLYVSYNGAKLKNFPSFPRWSYCSLINGSYLGIEDPMYYEYPDLKVGFFMEMKKQVI